MPFSAAHLTFLFGVLGNIISFIVFLSPLPTFYKIYKKKSGEGYQSIPYVVALFSSMLWIYYAFLKANTTLLITINTFGCFIETIYVSFFMFYATKKVRVQTLKMLGLMVVGGFGAVVLVSQFFFKGAVRAQVVGWVCLVFSLCVFVAPLCILRQVIRTKSVEHMPILLSVFLTLSAVIWFCYGLLLKDINIAIPNVLGFFFSILQMVLYMMYKDKNIKKDKKPFSAAAEQVLVVPQAPPVVLVILTDETQKHKLPGLSSELTTEHLIDLVRRGSLICPDKIQFPPAAATAVADVHIPVL
ncbi:unnamed protein product [Cuscuta epithymum]|uniref:Bidirectional sugar transporter SWEET n=1 Tax=Cuscuta epithymum TaxID=186058 RepID=A0AAV0C929_9ASTE|nr:unnamed protein product [Cuscuta epithymum]